MRKVINVKFKNIRNVNDFYGLNRRYSGRIRLEYGNGEGSFCLPGAGDTVCVIAEGSESELSELFDSYRLCGIA